jgi:hypothetical protein
LIAYSPRAARQVDDLRQHYEDRDRFEAVTAMFAALAEVEDKIARGVVGLPAPRPYPWLARPGWAWLKAGRYWVVSQFEI